MLTVNKLWISEKGMSLLELLLAITMVTVLAVGVAAFSDGVQHLAKRANQRVNLQEDNNFALKKFENFIMERQAEMDLGFKNIVYNPISETSFSLTMTSFNIAADNPNYQWNIFLLYDTEAASQIKMTKVTTPLDAEDRVEKISINSFRPWVRLKDYDKDGDIDAADVATRNACLSNFRQCGVVSGSIKDPPMPMMEISQDKSIVYFSFQPVRENKGNKVGLNIVPGITKSIYIQHDGSK